MSTAELKIKLIAGITSTNDDRLLEDMYRLLEIQTDETTPYKFTEEQLSMVSEAREEIKAGNFLTEDEANKRIREWFEK